MADTPKKAPGAGNGGSPMGAGPSEGAFDPSMIDQGIAPIVVRAQYLKDLSFESPGAPGTLSTMSEEPEVNINVNVEAQKLSDNDYEVALHLDVTANHNEQTIFIVEVVYAGLFTLTGVPEEAIQPVVLVEAPRLLFPFARNIVADATREGAFPPLMIQPVDFVGLYQQHMASQGGDAPTIEQA
jgi:preprotein translocase subunit SecB